MNETAGKVNLDSFTIPTASPSSVIVPVAPAYLSDPPVTVRVAFSVNSPGGLPGMGVSVTAPVAVYKSPWPEVGYVRSSPIAGPAP